MVHHATVESSGVVPPSRSRGGSFISTLLFLCVAMSTAEGFTTIPYTPTTISTRTRTFNVMDITPNGCGVSAATYVNDYYGQWLFRGSDDGTSPVSYRAANLTKGCEIDALSMYIWGCTGVANITTCRSLANIPPVYLPAFSGCPLNISDGAWFTYGDSYGKAYPLNTSKCFTAPPPSVTSGCVVMARVFAYGACVYGGTTDFCQEVADLGVQNRTPPCPINTVSSTRSNTRTATSSRTATGSSTSTTTKSRTVARSTTGTTSHTDTKPSSDSSTSSTTNTVMTTHTTSGTNTGTVRNTGTRPLSDSGTSSPTNTAPTTQTVGSTTTATDPTHTTSGIDTSTVSSTDTRSASRTREVRITKLPSLSAGRSVSDTVMQTLGRSRSASVSATMKQSQPTTTDSDTDTRQSSHQTTVSPASTTTGTQSNSVPPTAAVTPPRGKRLACNLRVFAPPGSENTIKPMPGTSLPQSLPVCKSQCECEK
jgi:hypothetical protein